MLDPKLHTAARTSRPQKADADARQTHQGRTAVAALGRIRALLDRRPASAMTACWGWSGVLRVMQSWNRRPLPRLEAPLV
jgi:hypothetical protein